MSIIKNNISWMLLLVIVFVGAGSTYYFYNQFEQLKQSPPKEAVRKSSIANTFVFDNFHGVTDITGKFRFTYPLNWNNEGQYFSPQKIEYYDQYSVKAPIYFDLILASIYDQTEFKYQIDQSRRKSPDSHGKIDGREFKKYDLIDYGSYGGDSAGRVIIYVGPKIIIAGKEYYLVFHWEEKPLADPLPGNDPAVFDKIVASLKFIN